MQGLLLGGSNEDRLPSALAGSPPDIFGGGSGVSNSWGVATWMNALDKNSRNDVEARHKVPPG